MRRSHSILSCGRNFPDIKWFHTQMSCVWKMLNSLTIIDRQIRKAANTALINFSRGTRMTRIKEYGKTGKVPQLSYPMQTSNIKQINKQTKPNISNPKETGKTNHQQINRHDYFLKQECKY